MITEIKHSVVRRVFYVISTTHIKVSSISDMDGKLVRGLIEKLDVDFC